MRNLIHFVARFNHIFIFLALEALSLIFVIRYHSYHRAGFLNSSGFVIGNIYNSYSRIKDFFSLASVNQQLMEENARLRNRLAILEDQQSVLPEWCDDLTGDFYFIPVKVINFTSNRIANYITVNKGASAGIRKDMGLITDQGIAGIINHVSENFATAMSVLHKDSRISIKIVRFNYPGTLQWNGGSPMEGVVTGIPQYLPIATGDTIVTSGFSAIFPANIPVGVITDYYPQKGSSFYIIKIRFTTPLDKLEYAYVVHNLNQEELRSLESQNKNE
ncbi:MAG: rod shape-determining protein MreC [Chitinophagales bacterium]|nr:MAG: rod shape-determining protein MreC [Chitinophagales bacterium]